MHFSSLFAQGLLAVGVSAWTGLRIAQQNGPTDPGISSDCTWRDVAVDKSFDCELFESDWDLTHKQFVEYVGHAYCIEVNDGFPRDEDPPKATTPEDAEPEPTEDSKPSPTQDGLIDTCTSFYKAKKGDTCNKIIAQYQTFDFDAFFEWNPAVGKDCRSLLVDYYVCVGTVGWNPPTKTMAKSTTTKAPSNGITTPTPIQANMVTNCNKFHLVKSTTTCTSIQSYYGITMADFTKWNPTVVFTCPALWANFNVCVGVIDGTPTNPGDDDSTPSPIQAGMASNCKKFHLIGSTTTCGSIQKYYSITMAQLAKWNLAVGAKCTALWAQ
ncbi:hypothetical protein AUP68_15289 [Ilyonectria robusta]